jgi:uncharacterized protein (DUF433 family)
VKALTSGIERTAGICGGDACIANTRITVWVLEQARRLGAADKEILQDYPSLAQGDLAAAWEYVETHHAEIERAIRENEEA